MNDFISREAVWEMLEKAHIISNGEYSGYCTEDIFIDDIPSADVQPVKRGHWFLRGGNWCCSYCNKKTLLVLESNVGGCRQYGTAKTNYCPNCGALMQEEE